jgi:Zn-dependent protease
MEGSWSIGRVAGIPVRLHWTLLVLVALFGLAQGAGALAALGGAALLFASVVAHEVAHAVVARGYGIRTRDIVLTPIGGVARLEGMPASGGAEVAIALAGPAMSLAIAAGAWALGLVAGKGVIAVVLASLFQSNLMLGLFNLLPAFPMDGGRVLRGFLHERLGLRAATDVAAGLGRVIAVAMGIAGIFWSMPSLVLVAVFVWIAGGREQRATEAEAFAPSFRSRATLAWDEHGRPIPAELVVPRRAPVRRIVFVRPIA